MIVCGTGNVDFTSDAFAKPFGFFFCGNAIDVGDFANKFVAGDAAKGMIAAQNLNVGVADAGQENAD